MQNVKGLDAQFEWFGLWKNEVLKTAGPEKGQYIIDNALYAISTGANDWVNNYYLNLNLQNKYTPEKYIDFLVGNLKKYTLVTTRTINSVLVPMTLLTRYMSEAHKRLLCCAGAV